MPVPRVTQLVPDPNLVDFGIGQPAFELLPLALLRDAAAYRLAQGDREFLNYGYEQGDERFREGLAGFLREHGGYEVSAGSLMVTCGASQGLDLICTHFTRPGDVIFVEEPTYFLALRIFAERGLRAVPVPTGSDGLHLDALEEMLARQQPALLYTVPTFQNPSGATLPATARERLVQLAQAHNFFVVADEVYHLLDYDAPPPPPLANLADSQRVLSLGSFSKILAPGLRLGWMEAAPTLLQRLTSSGLLDSGGGLNPFTSNIVGAILEHEQLAPHIAHLKTIYARRAAHLDAALQQYLGDFACYTKIKGGFFFWLTLPEGTNTERLLPEARNLGVAYQPGNRFSATGSLQNAMRLCFTFYDELQIDEGVARLAKLFV